MRKYIIPFDITLQKYKYFRRRFEYINRKIEENMRDPDMLEFFMKELEKYRKGWEVYEESYFYWESRIRGVQHVN